MEAKIGARRDADAILRHRAEHQRASRETAAVDDDARARLTNHGELLKIGTNLSTAIIRDAELSRSRRNTSKRNNGQNNGCEDPPHDPTPLFGPGPFWS